MTPTEKHYEKRKKSANRFKRFGQLAIGFSCIMLLTLLGSIVQRGHTGFFETRIQLPQAESLVFSLNNLPEIADHDEAIMKHGRREIRKLLSIAAHNQFKKSPWVTASANVDLWYKEKLTEEQLVADGRLSQHHIDWLKDWKKQGRVDLFFDTGFFTMGDSRESELAGFAASLVGSIFTVFCCLLVAFPMGVMTAIYLEEFAPKNRLSDIIEVNINNLAAVPSIVFGLLGVALYLGAFGMPRSASLVGGLTLAMLVLPVIIIATRAAIRAVPPSIRDAARGLGATELQVAMHHVLPLSLPGIMTGTILAIARAMGETAPLLMIGMVAFIADIPETMVDPASAMPVQVYLWASSPEIGFVEKTSAGIIVLLAVLLLLNLVAIIMRNRFERKW